MTPLAVCRWRKSQEEGRYVCHSAKFVNPPNIVPEAFCAACRYTDHEVPSPLPRTLPCVHLGAVAATPVKPGDPSRQLYACAVHGQCTILGTAEGGSRGDRSCPSCADYLGRDPCGPSSAQMLRHAEAFLAAIPNYPKERYHGRGVVIAGGGERFFPSLYVTVRALRHLGCRLPIQVWYLGRNHEMPAERKALLAPFDVECVDADEVRRRHPARRLGGWELKVFAALHSSFQELLFLDADCYPCRNPEFLFEREDYRARGAIFWPESMDIDTRLQWPAYGMPDPRRVGSIESGQFVIDKALCWQPLNLAWFYNDHSDYYYRYCHGDKHTFEVAWHRCAQPYVMWAPKTPWVDVAYLHLGPDFAPLFVHRCRDKFRFESHGYSTPQTHRLAAFHASLPLERECWGWMHELAPLMGHTKVFASYQPLSQIPLKLDPTRAYRVYEPSRGSPARKGAFAIGTLYTPEIAKLGQLTARVMRSYARRHGYTAVIATSLLDISRDPMWSKLVLVESYLTAHPACPWMAWIDADALITNPEKRLEDLVDEDVDFLVANDFPVSAINTGVFLIRNCAATIDLLRRAYAKTHYLDHHLREQTALYEALRESADTVRTRVVARRLFNSFANEFKTGDFIKHFPGWSLAAKLAGVKKAMKQTH